MLIPDGVRTVLFDLDGTLAENHPSANRVFFEQARRLGVSASPDHYRSALRWAHYYWAQSPELREDILLFGKGGAGFWCNYAQRHLAALGCSADQAGALAPEMYRHMEENYNPQTLVPPEAFPTLQSLRQAGYTLGLVTNRSEPCRQELEALGLLPYFDFITVAGEVQAWKPDVRIFEQALLMADSSPEAALYIGDNYYADVIGARRAGIRPVLLDPEGVFPEATCPVVDSLSGLVDLLGH